MHEKWIELDAFDAARRKRNEEKKREGFKTPVLNPRDKQQRRRLSVENHTLFECLW